MAIETTLATPVSPPSSAALTERDSPRPTDSASLARKRFRSRARAAPARESSQVPPNAGKPLLPRIGGAWNGNLLSRPGRAVCGKDGRRQLSSTIDTIVNCSCERP
jgi:hypothetical protein